MLIVVIIDVILSNAVHADCCIFTVKSNVIIPNVVKQSVVVPSVLAPYFCPFSAGYEKNSSEISPEDYIIKLLRPISIPYHNKLDRLSLNQFNPGLIVADKAGAYSS